jgi:phage/plasmid-like protein (TIGR03299 family)
MAHMIDTSNDRANIAYVGETPWHGLGQQLTDGADIATWQREAGLEWHAKKAPVLYQNGSLRMFGGKSVIYRDDTGAALSVVSDDYREVQPDEVMSFFAKLAEIGGFQLETAGSLSGGRRIWALARVNDGADVVNKDRVRPYILLATSYDGTMATTAKFTAIRVVCNNTISLAIPQSGRGGVEAGDSQDGAARNVVRVLHSQAFNPDEVRLQLGIVANAWERFQVRAGMLAGEPVSDAQADEFLRLLLSPFAPADRRSDELLRKSRGYRRVMDLFKGEARGYDLAGETKWGLLNAVTEFVDHERGRSDNSRLESAWFGSGSAVKDNALALLSK